MIDQELQHLRDRIAGTDDVAERIVLLNRLSYKLGGSDPREGLHVAKEALALAVAEKDRRGQAGAYRNIGSCHATMSNFATARFYIDRAYRMFERLADSGGMAAALRSHAVVDVHTGGYVQGLERLRRSVELAESIGDREGQVLALNTMGVLYDRLGDYPRALDYYYNSLRISEELGQVSSLALGNIGGAHYRMGNMEKAREFTERSLEYFKREGDSHNVALCLGNLGNAYYNLADEERAYRLWNESLALHEELGTQVYIANALRSIGEFHLLWGEYDKALDHYARARSIAEQIDSAPDLLEIHIQTAKVYQAMNDSDAALATYREAFDLATAIGARGDEMRVHEGLAEVYARRDEPGVALQHYRLYMSLQEELRGLAQQRALADLQIRAEIEATEKEREILRLKSERLELEMEHKSKELTTLAMQLVQKNEFLETLGGRVRSLKDEKDLSGAMNTLLREIDSNRNSEQEWDVFEQQFRSIHEDFIDRLARHCPDLSPTELKVCALLKINLSTKEIANILCSSPRTVEHHRYKVRSKLGLPTDTNLSVYFASF